MPIPNAKKHVLKNGLTLVSEAIPAVRSVAVGVLVGAGAANETNQESGISHLIEHMCFKGTHRRSAFDIAHALEAVGGKMNAFTGKEQTMYYAVVLDKHIDIALDVLSDMILNSAHDRKHLELEKGVILEEINMYEDTPDELIHDFFIKKILHGHPVGKATIGSKKSVRSFKREAIINYQKKWYSPKNSIVAVAGAMPKNIEDRVQRYFGNWRGKVAQHKQMAPGFKGGVYLKKKQTEQVHLCLGSKGVSQIDNDRYPYAVLDNILGGSMTSRLFQEVREKRGLAYSIYSTSAPFRNYGVSYVYAGMSKENLTQVIELILHQFCKIKKEGVRPEELERARESIKGTLVLGLESTSARMSWLTRSEYYYKRSMTIDEIFKKVDQIKQDDIIRLANEYFRDEYLTLAVLGDLDSLPIKNLKC